MAVLYFSIIKLFQSFSLSVPILVIITVFTEGIPTQLNLQKIVGITYVGLFEMGLAFICWQMALHLTDKVSRVSTLIFLSPFISLFTIHHLLGEPLHLMTFLGLGAIVVGIMVQQYASRI